MTVEATVTSGEFGLELSNGVKPSRAPEVMAVIGGGASGLGAAFRLMTAGDSLQSIAQQEYGDPGMWRGLAELNGVDDPFRVSSGTTLLIAGDDELAAAAAVDH